VKRKATLLRAYAKEITWIEAAEVNEPVFVPSNRSNLVGHSRSKPSEQFFGTRLSNSTMWSCRPINNPGEAKWKTAVSSSGNNSTTP